MEDELLGIKDKWFFTCSTQRPERPSCIGRQNVLSMISLVLSCVFYSPAASAIYWVFNNCDTLPSPAKGAYYAEGGGAGFWGPAGTVGLACWGGYAETALGACNSVMAQANASSLPGLSGFSHAELLPNYPVGLWKTDSRDSLASWGRCYFHPSDGEWHSQGGAFVIRLPQNYTITLSGGSQAEPSKGADITPLPIVATVIDQSTGQPTTKSVKVRISLKVAPTSGGHDHGDSTRLRGGIANVGTCPSDATCWSETSPANNGVVVFNFNAPEASGTHTITATCDGCSNTATKTVNVKVDGLNPIPVLPFYALVETNGDVIGAKAGWHTDNHNLTSAAAAVLTKIAVNYRFNPQFYLRDPATNAISFPPVLHLNDASLPWGGVYDICARPNACPDMGIVAWYKPHAEHRRGTVIDVRANGADGSIPTSNMEAFKRYLRRTKLPFLQESIGTSNEHFHIRLMKKKE